jgi:hypothetical protein
VRGTYKVQQKFELSYQFKEEDQIFPSADSIGFITEAILPRFLNGI